jgi:hypothetical protein
MDAQSLRHALEATFAGRGTRSRPDHLPDPPPAWSTPYRRLASEAGVNFRTLGDAGEAARRFLDPALHAETDGTWDPVDSSWKMPAETEDPAG